MKRLLDIQYNAEKEKLIIPEYGRNIQELILYAKSIEDQEKQQAIVEEIVELMKKMKVGNKKSPEYKEKIWVHVYKIANYELKAVPPSGIIPEPKPKDFKPQKLDYPTTEKHYRHYGHFIHSLIDKAINMEEGLKKTQFIAHIGAYMKMAYKTWSPDHYVNDKIIKEDLKKMSNGELVFPDGYSMDIFLEKENKNYGNRNRSSKSSKRRISRK